MQHLEDQQADAKRSFNNSNNNQAGNPILTH